MRKITKSREPRSLASYRRQPHATYTGMPEPERTDLKNYLLTEQGHVCAYCMQRIKFDSMRVEHWASQHAHPGSQLEYTNLLACCTGNEGRARKTYTCDKRKENSPLTYSPADPTHRIDTRIQYLGNGKIKSDDAIFNIELNEVLNLNETRLVANRKAAIEALQKQLDKRPGTRTKAQLRSMHTQVISKNATNQLKPFWGVMAYYLEKRM